MPKRSRFEAMPQGDWANVVQVSDRTTRRIQRDYEYGRNLLHAGFRMDTALDLLQLRMIRSFGFVDTVPGQRQLFASYTGRLAYLQRAFREVLDRRRRQAYLLLRRVLPIELAGRITLQ